MCIYAGCAYMRGIFSTFRAIGSQQTMCIYAGCAYIRVAYMRGRLCMKNSFSSRKTFLYRLFQSHKSMKNLLFTYFQLSECRKRLASSQQNLITNKLNT